MFFFGQNSSSINPEKFDTEIQERQDLDDIKAIQHLTGRTNSQAEYSYSYLFGLIRIYIFGKLKGDVFGDFCRVATPSDLLLFLVIFHIA